MSEGDGSDESRSEDQPRAEAEPLLEGQSTYLQEGEVRDEETSRRLHDTAEEETD